MTLKAVLVSNEKEQVCSDTDTRTPSPLLIAKLICYQYVADVCVCRGLNVIYPPPLPESGKAKMPIQVTSGNKLKIDIMNNS